jgi:glycogen(starch) synthase
MKVLMLGWELPPFNSGGLGEACLGLAKALAKKGIQVTFVLPKTQDVKIDGVNIVFADIEEEMMAIRSASYTTSTEWARLFNKDEMPPDFVVGAMQFAKKITSLVKKYQSDIIHSHDWFTYPAGIVAKNAMAKPLVAHVHSTEFDRTGGNFPNQTIYDIERNGLLAADRVLPVGGFMKNILVERYGVDPQKIKVIYNGIDRINEKYYPAALNAFKKLGYKVVLFLGRITLQKGPEYFVRAAAKTLKYHPKALFVVTGSGDMQPFMISEAARLGVLDKFIFTGFLRGADKDKIYQSADIYVMPSVSEPFGITALEAAANGTPVLLSKQSGVSEVLRNCLRTDFWDIDEMANKIIAALRFKSLSKDLIREGDKEIDNLSWSRAADKVIEVYKELV